MDILTESLQVLSWSKPQVAGRMGAKKGPPTRIYTGERSFTTGGRPRMTLPAGLLAWCRLVPAQRTWDIPGAREKRAWKPDFCM
jgi:hypothetical protein